MLISNNDLYSRYYGCEPLTGNSTSKNGKPRTDNRIQVLSRIDKKIISTRDPENISGRKYYSKRKFSYRFYTYCNQRNNEGYPYRGGWKGNLALLYQSRRKLYYVIFGRPAQ